MVNGQHANEIHGNLIHFKQLTFCQILNLQCNESNGVHFRQKPQHKNKIATLFNWGMNQSETKDKLKIDGHSA